MPWKYAIEIIRDSTFFFSHYECFDDNLEGELPVTTIEYWKKEELRNGWPKGDSEKFLEGLVARRKRSFASCWRADTNLWIPGFDKYGSENCVYLETNAEKLINALKIALERSGPKYFNAGTGLVHYAESDEKFPTNNGLFHLMRKNIKFAWEREARSILYLEDLNLPGIICNSDRRVLGYKLQLLSNDWITGVHLSPRIETSVIDQIHEACVGAEISNVKLVEFGN
jgi:hypothetical protein